MPMRLERDESEAREHIAWLKSRIAWAQHREDDTEEREHWVRALTMYNRVLARARKAEKRGEST